VLQDFPPSGDVNEAVDAWIAANPAAERYQQTLADIRVGRVFDLTTLPVALREVRNLIQAPSVAGLPVGADGPDVVAAPDFERRRR
jgi:hypothetical protein